MSGERGRSAGAGRHKARLPGERPGALPTRTTDRVEDLGAWLLTTLALLAVLGAVGVGRAAHAAALAPGRTDHDSPVRVVLLADVPPAPTADRRFEFVPPPVPVSWSAGDGVERIGELALRSPLPAGAEVTAWADPEGRLSATPPEHASEAVAFGVGAGLTTVAGVWAALTLLWAALRRVTAARNAAAWEREWAGVEPVWSRRPR